MYVTTARPLGVSNCFLFFALSDFRTLLSYSKFPGKHNNHLKPPFSLEIFPLGALRSAPVWTVAL